MTSVLRDLYPEHLGNDTPQHVPPIFAAFRAMGRFIGLGVRPERLATMVD